jgi:hypothetical protein
MCMPHLQRRTCSAAAAAALPRSCASENSASPGTPSSWLTPSPEHPARVVLSLEGYVNNQKNQPHSHQGQHLLKLNKLKLGTLVSSATKAEIMYVTTI